ncbi:MAG: phosphatidate cytidylyltransferase [Hydrogenophilus sp.]|nr:phosphatidate cytidylyltransferase [Hydrogenophilus sp.]
MSELVKRTATAAVALVLFLALLFGAPPLAWAFFVVAMVGVAAWEWGQLTGLSRVEAIGFAVLVTVATAVLWRVSGIAIGIVDRTVAGAVVLPALFFWVGIAPLLMGRRIPGLRGWVGLMVGATVLVAAGIAMLGLSAQGPGVVLAAVTLVWVIDTAAFFVGRRYGSRKLAEHISPNKTWAGLYGALGAGTLYGVILYPLLGDASGFWGWVGAMTGASALGVIGDLWESWLKRLAGVRESGHLLPGHGGVLDRVDALVAVLPFLAFWWLGW